MDDYRKGPTFDTYGEIDMVSNQTDHSEMPGDWSQQPSPM